MTKRLRLNLITALLLATIISVAGVFCIFNSPRSANAEEIDYINLFYQDLPTDDTGFYTHSDDFDFLNEKVVYKIHCPNVRGSITFADELWDAYSVLTFGYDPGIYFVCGVPCAFEDVDYGDNETTQNSEYYDILHYDQENENVYIKFKNFEELANEPNISIQHGSYVHKVQYTDDVSAGGKLTAEDVTVQSVYNGRSLEITNFVFDVKVSVPKSKINSVGSVEISLSDNDNFAYNSTLDISDGILADTLIEFTATVKTTLAHVDDVILANVVVTTTSGETITVSTASFSILSIWRSALDAGEMGNDIPEETIALIEKLVDSTTSGFGAKILASEFLPFVDGESIPLTADSIILRYDANSFNTCLLTSSFNFNDYTISISLDKDELTIESTGELLNDVSDVAGCVRMSVIGDYVYIGFTTDVYSFFPGGKVLLTSDADTYVNSTVINTDALEAEITTLQGRIAELEKKCADYEKALSEKNAKIAELENLVATLTAENENLTKEIATLQSEIEDYKAQISNLEKQLSEKDAEVESLSAEIKSLETQLADATAKVHELEETKKVNTANILALTSELETKKDEYAALKKDYDALVTQLEGDTSELAALLVERNKRIKELESRVEELEKENEQLKKDQEKGVVVSGSSSCSSCSGGTPSAGIGAGDGTALLMAPLFVGTFMLMRWKRGKEEE